MTKLDYAVLVAFFVFSLAFGLWLIRNVAGRMKSITEFFLSGRSLPWWLLGTSMVATTFAADAPILAARTSAEFGLYFSWMFVPLLLSATMTTFFFARVWHRSGVLTDVELLERRYPGPAGRFLRGFKALYLGGLINTLIIGSQLIAIGVIGESVLGINLHVSMLIGAAIALAYSVVAGFTGVVLTDFLQFIIAMVGSLLLAWFAIRMPEVGGLSGLVSKLSAGVVRETPNGSVTVPVLKMLPSTTTPFMTIYIMLIPLFVNWWSVVSGGMEPGGGGQVVQRILAAKNEKHAAGATLWFSVAHYAIRVWPWLLVGLACVIIYPDMDEWHGVYARAIRDTLPSGLRGLVVASFFAAFISTMDTRLNLGAAYLINDFYRRFWVRDRDEKHYVTASRIVTVLFCAVPFLVPYLFGKDLLSVLMFWLEITAGTGLVYILRWYWWRINAWSEISAMVGAVVYTVVLLGWRYDWNVAAYADRPPSESLVNILIITILTTVTWIAVTLLTPPENEEGLDHFYCKARPAGNGWARFSRKHKEADGLISPDNMGLSLVGWLSASVFLFTVFFGTGKLLLLEFRWGLALLALSCICLVIMIRTIRRMFA